MRAYVRHSARVLQQERKHRVNSDASGTPVRIGRMMRTIAAVLISTGLLAVQAAKGPSQAPNPLQVKTLLQTDKAWDDKLYTTYSSGNPQLSVLQITIPPHTT